MPWATLVLAATLAVTAGSLGCGAPSSVRHVPLPPASAEPAPDSAVFSAPSIGVAFEYPDQWRLRADRRDQGGSELLLLTFTTGRTAPGGAPETGGITLRRIADDTDAPLEEWVRANLRDTRGLLGFTTCTFPSRALECLEVTDQTRWLAAGRTPPQYTVYLKTPGWVYSAAWGEADTFDYRGTGGRLLLESLRFGEK